MIRNSRDVLAIIIVWCASIAALIVLVCPGLWRLLAVVPVLAVCAAAAVLKPPRGSHADVAGLGVSSPGPSPADTSPYFADGLAAWEAAGRPHVAPLLCEVGGAVSGAMCDDRDKAELWPGHNDDDRYGLPELPAAGAQRAPVPPAAGSSPPGLGVQGVFLPAPVPAPSPGGPTRLASEDTAFRAGLAAEVLAYERALTAGAHEFIDRGWSAVAAWTRELGELS